MNRATIIGTIVSPYKFEKKVGKEELYSVEISAKRKSGMADCIQLMVSGLCTDTTKNDEGRRVIVSGTVKSRMTDKGHKTYIDVEYISDSEDSDYNNVIAEGYITKRRESIKIRNGNTLVRGRVVCSSENRDEYIMSLFWGKAAEKVQKLGERVHVEIQGRLQSRMYVKKYEDGRKEEKVTYELSVYRIEEK